MTIIDGEYREESVDAILDAMIADAKEYFGADLKDDEQSVIRTFYYPIAQKIHELQTDIGLVLESAQLANATDTELDLLTALIGVRREEASAATGEVEFSRSSAAGTNYTIPEGTLVQTDSNDPSRYATTESATINEGSTSVTVPIEAVEGGVEHNTGSNTVVVMPDPPAGIEDVTNPADVTGGKDEEPDDELRQRARDELADGSRASAPALINSVRKVDGVTSVSIFVNDSSVDYTNDGGLPDHSFEVVANGGNENEIAQEILETKAAGDTSYGGANGTETVATTDLPNGQTHDISFSRPAEIQIYADMSLKVTDEFAGIDAVRDNIVNYVGGLLSSGNEYTGELGVGDDVLYGEVEFAVRGTAGVYDVTNLTIGTSSTPEGTSNINIANSDVAISDATDESMTISTTQI